MTGTLPEKPAGCFSGPETVLGLISIVSEEESEAEPCSRSHLGLFPLGILMPALQVDIT